MHTTKNIRHPSASNKHHILVESLEAFFTTKARHEKHMKVFLSLVEKGAKISLRIIDWFVTNYSKEKDIRYTTKSADGHNRMFNVHESYKAQLKAYSKRQFDPFCRRQRILFHYELKNKENGKRELHKIRTTVGQLNFFRWAIDNKVIDYIKEHIEHIEECMRAYVRAQREEKRKLQQESTGTIKAKTRRRTNPKDFHHSTKNANNNKTLRKGSIVTNRTHTTVFFS